MEAYVSGVSTRAVDDLVKAMGVDAGISKSEVSRICAGLDERVNAFRNRTLGHASFVYIYLDATYVNVRDDALGQVVSRAIVVAISTSRGKLKCNKLPGKRACVCVFVHVTDGSLQYRRWLE